MKKINLLLAIVILTVSGLFAQTPEQFKYQAVLRDASGDIMASQTVSVNIKILQTTSTGTVVFTEDHTVTTTAQGLININVGDTEDLSVVDWAADVFFVKITVNGTEMGTSQLLRVPYAVNAKTADNAYWHKNVLNNIFYYDGDVGIGNNAPQANLHVVGGAKFGFNGKVIDEIIEISGTTSANNSYTSINYPTGYNKTNTRVLSLEIAYLGVSWMSMGPDIKAGLLTNSIYLYHPENNSYNNRPYRLILMKVQ